MASKFAASLPARQVFLNVRPPPRKIHHSREILKALQQFGEYEKRLYGPAGILAIFTTPEAAEKAIHTSQIHVEVSNPLAPSSSPLPSLSPPSNPSPTPTVTTTYRVKITPSYIDHGARVDQNPYSGLWKFSSNSLLYEEMTQETVPRITHGDCSPHKSDHLDARELSLRAQLLKKKVADIEGLMELWRRGIRESEEGKNEKAVK